MYLHLGTRTDNSQVNDFSWLHLARLVFKSQNIGNARVVHGNDQVSISPIGNDAATPGGKALCQLELVISQRWLVCSWSISVSTIESIHENLQKDLWTSAASKPAYHENGPKCAKRVGDAVALKK